GLAAASPPGLLGRAVVPAAVVADGVAPDPVRSSNTPATPATATPDAAITPVRRKRRRVHAVEGRWGVGWGATPRDRRGPGMRNAGEPDPHPCGRVTAIRWQPADRGSDLLRPEGRTWAHRVHGFAQRSIAPIRCTPSSCEISPAWKASCVKFRFRIEARVWT